MGGNLVYILTTFLKKVNVHVNSKELKLQLQSHPSYPSLHSLTGVLDHFNIENLALEVPVNLETLEQLPKHFIAHMNGESSEFVLVKQFETTVELLYGKKNRTKISKTEFLDIWSGVLLAVEEDDNSEVQRAGNTNQNRILLITTSLALLGITIYNLEFDLFSTAYFLLSLLGVYISSLIVQQELGYSRPSLDKMCGNTKTISCTEVLSSKGSFLFGSYKLSDLSLVYFLGLIMYTIVASISTNGLTDAAVIVSFLALPITLYSIYYQYIVVKKWCTLCLVIVVVLWLQCCSTLFYDHALMSIEFDLVDNFILFFSFLLSLIVWSQLKALIKDQKSFNEITLKHLRFKRNFSVFNSLLQKSKSYGTGLINNHEIILGDQYAPISILLVTNPACFFCREAHMDIEKIRTDHTNAINVIIRFNVPEQMDAISNQVALRLLEIYNSGGEIRAALNDAYAQNVDLEQWQRKWGHVSEDLYTNILNEQRRWCHENAVNFTPAVFVNGKEFPREYNRPDLTFFIEDLLEQSKLEEFPYEAQNVS